MPKINKYDDKGSSCLNTLFDIICLFGCLFISILYLTDEIYSIIHDTHFGENPIFSNNPCINGYSNL